MGVNGPLSPTILTIGSLKGGIGKSTLALNLAQGLSRLGKKVLLIDLNPSSRHILDRSDKGGSPQGMVQLLKGMATPSSVLRPVTLDDEYGFHMVSTRVSTPNEALFFEKEAMDHKVPPLVEQLSRGFEVVLLDAPSGLGSVAKAALESSHWAFAVSTCEAETLRALPLYTTLISWIRVHRNRLLNFGGVLIQKFDNHSKIQDTICTSLTKRLGTIFLNTKVPLDQRFEVAALRSVPFWRLPGAEDLVGVFEGLAQEILDILFNKEARDALSQQIDNISGHTQWLESQLGAICKEYGLECAIVSDGLGFPIVHYNIGEGAELFAAFGPLAGDTMGRAGDMLDLGQVDQMVLGIGDLKVLLVKRLESEKENYYFLALLPKGFEWRQGLSASISRLVDGL